MKTNIIYQKYASYTGKTVEEVKETSDSSLLKAQQKNYTVTKTSYIVTNSNKIQDNEQTDEENIIKDLEKSNYKTILTPAF